MDYFHPKMQLRDVNAVSVLGLAHIGDAVYEILVRTMLCEEHITTVAELHRRTIEYVSAVEQAKASAAIRGCLDAEEETVFRRGRNTKVNSVPKHAEIGDYHLATALETLLGWLYLQGRTERINELFAIIKEAHDAV